MYTSMCFLIVLIICFIFIFYYQVNGDLAQLARASALQAEGQGFKSPNLHTKLFFEITRDGNDKHAVALLRVMAAGRTERSDVRPVT